MTDNDTLRTLWELLDKGRHQAWAKEVERMDDGTFVLYLPDTNHDSYAFLDDRLLVAILRDSVEGWLVEEGWNIIAPGVTLTREYEHSGHGTEYIGLIDAVRYAREQEETCK